MRWTPLLVCGSIWLGQPAIKIDLAHGTERERQTKTLLEQVLASYDLSKYTFTRQVVIEDCRGRPQASS